MAGKYIVVIRGTRFGFLLIMNQYSNMLILSSAVVLLSDSDESD